MQETQFQFLGGEIPWRSEMAPHSSILAWKIPWTEEPGVIQSMGSHRVGHDWVTNTHKKIILFFSNFCLLPGYQYQFSHSVVSDSLWPHEPQHARPPCPSPAPGVYQNSCPLISDAIQPSHPLSSPSPPTFSLSQHQGYMWLVISNSFLWLFWGDS